MAQCIDTKKPLIKKKVREEKRESSAKEYYKIVCCFSYLLCAIDDFLILVNLYFYLKKYQNGRQ